MERLNKIFAEWAKDDKRTELKSEKVELASIADLKKALGAAQKSFLNKYRKARSNFDDSRRDLVNAIDELESRNSVLEKRINEFSKAAKDLGLNPNSVKEYSESETVLQDLKSIAKNTKL